MSLMMRVMFAMTSCGKRMLLIALVRMPSASALTKIVRLSPNSPPTPFSVNPKLSWIGVNSAVIRISSEKPGEPSGIFVLMIADRFDREEALEIELQRAGVFAALVVEA